MMNRRHFLTLLAVLLGIPAQKVRAYTECQNTWQGRICKSEIDFYSFAQYSYQSQRASQWCWAACISMLFSYYDHPVNQARIVSDVYGGIVNMPAMAGIVMARQLNRRWIDDNGNRFRARLTAAYDFDARIHSVNNNLLINELHRNRPIIIGNSSHAMVMTNIEYQETPHGPNVGRVGVFDPWPGIGARNLSVAEMLPMHLGGALRFVATVRVS